MIRVAIVEDQTLFRESLIEALSGEPDIEVSGSYPDAESALESLRSSQCHIAIVDYVLPNMNGIALARKLKEANSKVSVIILSVVVHEKCLMEAFEAGVMAYLPKDADMEDLVRALRSVHNGEVVISPKICGKFIDYVGRLKDPSAGNPILTDEEKKLLICAGKGLANKEIAQRLNTTISAIKTKFQRLFRKLQAKDRTNAVIKAVQIGAISFCDADPEMEDASR